MLPISAAQSRAANSISVSSTDCRSKVERLITFSTSAVAVCCSSDSRDASLHRLKQPDVLDRDNGLVGEGLYSAICFRKKVDL